MNQFEIIVKACLADSNFHAQETDERRQELAAVLANAVVAQNTLEGSDPQFVPLESSDEIVLEAANEGELIRFKNAILCREETNKNGDVISAENINELAASIVGRAVDIDHNRSKNAGIITEAKAGQDKGRAALFVGGLLWRDRYPIEVDGVRSGKNQLSVEAMADLAICSICNQSFGMSSKYCNHLTARKVSGAKRSFNGLRGKGMGITPKPAGTAQFDRDSIYVVANHQEEMAMNCPHCGKEATGDSCPACNKSLVPSIIASELKDATDKLNALQASFDQAKVQVGDLQNRLDAAEAKVKEADAQALKVRNEGREKELAALLGADKLEERKNSLLALEDEAFNAVTASLKEAKETQVRKNGGAAIRLGASEQNTSGSKKLTLR